MSSSGRLLWPLVAELRLCTRGDIPTQLTQMFPVANLSSCFSTSMIHFTIRDVSNAIRFIQTNATARQWPLYRSYGVIIYAVITCHENAYTNKSWQNRVTQLYAKCLCLSCHDATTDMQYDLPESFIRSVHLPWPQIRFSTWPIGISMHMFWFVSTRQTRWC